MIKTTLPKQRFTTTKMSVLVRDNYHSKTKNLENSQLLSKINKIYKINEFKVSKMFLFTINKMIVCFIQRFIYFINNVNKIDRAF